MWVAGTNVLLPACRFKMASFAQVVAILTTAAHD